MDEATRELARQEDPEVRADLARRHLRGGEPEAALEALGAYGRGDPAEVHALRCEALCELVRYEEAAALARAATPPRSPRACWIGWPESSPSRT